MDKTKIARINALAKKAKTVGLNERETAERDALRKEYLAVVLGELHGSGTVDAPIRVRDGLREIARRQGLDRVSRLTGGVLPW